MELMTKKDVAALLKVSARTVDRLRKAGRLRAARVGGRARFRRGDVEAYLAAQAGEGPALYRALRFGEAAEPDGGVEGWRDCGQAPSGLGRQRGLWACGELCGARVVVPEDRRRLWGAPGLRCPACRRGLSFLRYVEPVALAPAG